MNLLICQVVRQKVVGIITTYQFWSTMVDENSGVSTFQRQITSVQYAVKGEVKVRLTDVGSINQPDAAATDSR